MAKHSSIAKLKKLKPPDVIATREYQLVTRTGKKQRVLARFGRPLPFPGSRGESSYCIFQIEGLDEQAYLAEPQFAPGVDGVQALFIAFQLAWGILFSTEAYREGRLSFWGIPALGLPHLHVSSEDARRAAGASAKRRSGTDKRSRA